MHVTEEKCCCTAEKALVFDHVVYVCHFSAEHEHWTSETGLQDVGSSSHNQPAEGQSGESGPVTVSILDKFSDQIPANCCTSV